MIDRREASFVKSPEKAEVMAHAENRFREEALAARENGHNMKAVSREVFAEHAGKLAGEAYDRGFNMWEFKPIDVFNLSVDSSRRTSALRKK